MHIIPSTKPPYMYGWKGPTSSSGEKLRAIRKIFMM